MNSLPKKTIALIVSLFIVTGILLAAAFSVSQNQQVIPQPVNDTSEKKLAPSPTPLAQTLLSFAPSLVNVSASSEATLSVLMQTGSNQVTAVQLELSYDPAVINTITVKPDSFFHNGTVLLNDNNNQTGRLSFAEGVSPSDMPIIGSGIVATITVTTKKQATASASTAINLLPKSLVSSRGIEQSVLSKATGATIILSPISLPSSPIAH